MAGGYAHVLAARRAIERVEDWQGLTNDLRAAAFIYRGYVEIGSVAPDYPYLHLSLGDQGKWADAMHYRTTAGPVRAGIRYLRGLEPGSTARECGTAWLMGYVAHLATDLTIHPVVQAKVGPYEGNQTDHRICEMNQDAHIWRQARTGGLGVAGMFEHVMTLVSDAEGRMMPDVASLWRHMLQDAYPDLWEALPPQIEGWHAGYGKVLKLISQSHELPAFGRHILANEGVAYPTQGEADPQYLENLDTPHGSMHYDVVMVRAVESIGAAWSDLGAALTAPADAAVSLASLPDANLDTGEADADHSLVAWRTA